MNETKNSEKALIEEISNITYHYTGISWDEAWSLDYLERTIVVNNLSNINKQKEKASKRKSR